MLPNSHNASQICHAARHNYQVIDKRMTNLRWWLEWRIACPDLDAKLLDSTMRYDAVDLAWTGIVKT